MLLHLLCLLILLILNVIVIFHLRGLKSSVAAGIEFTLTGIFLAGYWLGYKWGIIIGIIFILSSYLSQIDVINPYMLITFPLSIIVSIAGAFTAQANFSIITSAICVIAVYCLLSDLLMTKLLGESDYVQLFMYDIGAILVNYVFFRMFF